MNKLELGRLSYAVSGARVMLIAARILHLLGKYSPSQPRAPAGQPEGGQWVPWNRSPTVAGPFDEINRAKCEAQYESDLFQCSFAASGRSGAACREQAMSRYMLCMKGLPIPGHIYLLGGAR
jgi:hypothetical protein